MTAVVYLEKIINFAHSSNLIHLFSVVGKVSEKVWTAMSDLTTSFVNVSIFVFSIYAHAIIFYSHLHMHVYLLSCIAPQIIFIRQRDFIGLNILH